MGMIDREDTLKAMDTWDKFGNDPNEGLIPLRTPALQDRYVPYVKYDDMVKAVNSMSTVEAIPKADYENRLKADMVAMLTELQLEIEEKFNDRPFSYNHHQRTEFYRDIDEIIQQKINALKKLNARCELCKFYRFDDWWAIGWCPKPSIYEVRKEPGDKCEYFESKENKDGNNDNANE